MIRSLTGTITSIADQSLVIDVQGVGYLVHVAHSEHYSLATEITLWTHLAVRENAMDLYGFTTRDELDIFELLLTLPKVGPKSAAQILAQADITLLKQAVSQGDPSYLSKMSGIGKKTAEKIVHELSDKLELLGGSEGTAGTDTSRPAHHDDTVDALLALGYAERDVRQAMQQLPEDISTPNEAIRAALKLLSN